MEALSLVAGSAFLEPNATDAGATRVNDGEAFKRDSSQLHRRHRHKRCLCGLRLACGRALTGQVKFESQVWTALTMNWWRTM